MSNNTYDYIDYESICSHCQQILQTIHLTNQQGIFIDDLTLIQQELESVLIAANQREEFLRNSTGEHLQLPYTSMMNLYRIRNDRFQKRKRKRKRPLVSRSTKKSQQQIKDLTTKGHCQIEQMYLLDQFWSTFQSYQYNFIEQIEIIQNLIQENDILLDKLQQQKQNEYLQIDHHFINETQQYLHYYSHPELKYSIVIQRNQRFYHLIQRLSNNQRYKRKYSSIIKTNPSINITEYFQRDQPRFSSKFSELEYHIHECLQLEHLALKRAKQQSKYNDISLQIFNIDEKIFDIIQSNCQYSRANMFVVNQNSNRIKINRTTMNMDEQLEYLIQHRMQYEKQLDEQQD